MFKLIYSPQDGALANFTLADVKRLAGSYRLDLSNLYFDVVQKSTPLIAQYPKQVHEQQLEVQQQQVDCRRQRQLLQVQDETLFLPHLLSLELADHLEQTITFESSHYIYYLDHGITKFADDMKLPAWMSIDLIFAGLNVMKAKASELLVVSRSGISFKVESDAETDTETGEELVGSKLIVKVSLQLSRPRSWMKIRSLISTSDSKSMEYPFILICVEGNSFDELRAYKFADGFSNSIHDRS